MIRTLIDRLGCALQRESFRSPRTGKLPLGLTLILLGCIAIFALLTISVALGNPLAPIDQALTAWLQRSRSDSIDRWMIGITLLGDGWHWVLFSLLICTLFGLNRNPAAIAHWFGALLLLMLLNQLFKFGLALPRPPVLAQPLDSFSYPSAHASNSTLILALLASFIAQQQPYARRWLIYSLAALPILAVGISRIYLGVHWFSDIVAGFALGLAVCAATRLSYSRFDRHPVEWHGIWLGLVATLISATYLFSRLDDAVIRYLPSS